MWPAQAQEIQQMIENPSKHLFLDVDTRISLDDLGSDIIQAASPDEDTGHALPNQEADPISGTGSDSTELDLSDAADSTHPIAETIDQFGEADDTILEEVILQHVVAA
ncbi:hypothetical protein A4A49_19355 [Nicotiana attenuata]|uniref:Uncharacterized protein n=1 Tax=Nicotiana attenuata TaxID=49451 RepID=A0A1J6IDL1_NICAT|nr:hypothetical protein A4A49_19355 [Nicotiana attenuata]